MASVDHCLFCFEVLSANLEKRTPMTLSEVQKAWAEYPKGLENDETLLSEQEEENERPSVSVPRNPALQRLSNSRSPASGSSTPVSNSSSLSLGPDTAATTPESSTPSFVPMGQHPTRTSQRKTITESPLFVTWNTITPSGSRNLRGCIGTFESQPLPAGLTSFTIASALQDHRFSPITLRELPTLEVAVTLLTDFEACDTPLDWELGVHGTRLSFYARNRNWGACYLPDVAPEQGWDREETVASLVRKAGYSGRKWKELDLKV
ncbi:Uncharacterized protein LSUE1_G005286, partial [Lachnellula suecica]